MLVGVVQMLAATVWVQLADPFAIVAGDGTVPVTFESTGPEMAQQLRKWLLLGQVFRWLVLYPRSTAALGVLAFAAVFLFTGAAPPLAKCVSVATHAFCAGDLARLLLGLIVSAAGSEWHVAPADAALLDPSLFLETSARTGQLGCLLGALDLLLVWKLWIVAVGLGIAGGMSTGTASALVFAAWLIHAAGRAWIVCG